MIFNSLTYIFFLFIVVAAYYLTPGRLRWLLLLAASILYYVSFIPYFLVVILAVIVVNYFSAGYMSKFPEFSRYKFLIVIVCINLIILAIFKYFNLLFPDFEVHLSEMDAYFKISSINKMVLPIGLSYLIFTIISYQVEIQRNNFNHEKHLGYFSLYILFFPKIAQGPIERPQKLLPQLREFHGFDSSLVVGGLKQILWGYFKKLVVADRLALYVNAVYNNSEQHNGTSLLIATFFFSFQIYADFSGYTDIALGSAKLFGFSLTDNFRRPYLASSIKEFWDRWHITFSAWLRDYLFLPLAVLLSRLLKRPRYLFVSTGKWVYMIAIMLTFAVCGIWHGVGWTYLVWGVIFGIYLTYSNFIRDINKKIRKRFHINKNSRLRRLSQIIVTFTLVMFAWIFFRAETFKEATWIIKSIFCSPGIPFYETMSSMIFSVFGIGFLIFIDFKREFYNDRFSVINSENQFIEIAGITFLFTMIMLIGVFDGGQFIYFQF